jgi:hypothetical protein
MAEGRFVRSKNLAVLIAICIYFKKWHWELRLFVILYFIAFESWNQDKWKGHIFLGEIPSLGLSFFSSGWWGIVLASKNTGSKIFVGGEAQIPLETMTFLGIFKPTQYEVVQKIKKISKLHHVWVFVKLPHEKKMK